MPRGGKRKGGTPEEEVDDAASRMRKRPEHLKSARSSEAWQGFLSDLGIMTREADFWERVRDKIYVDPRPTVKFVLKMQERGVSVEYIVKRGYAIHRDMKSGRFTKKTY